MLIGFVTVVTGGNLNFLNDEVTSRLFDFAIGYLVYVSYYTLMEGATKGSTIGKLLTKTKAVDTISYKPITWRKAWQRSICRIIPFEIFSALGVAPWHDTITNTTVVKSSSLRQNDLYLNE